MGCLSDRLREEYKDLQIKEVYATKLGDTDIEILEVSKDGQKFIAMFQSRLLKDGIFQWSLIITSANNTRTIKGLDPMDGIKLALKSSIDAMIAGMKE
ncbi:hypothetical protein TON_1679 [Thermococcus onnurineus NA1]|uniref:Uncharacterized protein n=1 Tax=Thermococcus onnurineus (strain NA1) TaxID=523850 RepID=B6YUI4_THEON|nr:MULTISPECIES: hypothetical protein [Thermococcus]ACJ17169.1 hypothetical protein TON_1679 [Thermococcus onnurineus NA1]NJE46100.1 hypothetical protein [Thermococcus sp. GR7]NJE78264.1 hypothetical protein [Thermococcus sp. GR4]NJF22297.1 hypothetical protein [Thermococcus sp. GR5]